MGQVQSEECGSDSGAGASSRVVAGEEWRSRRKKENKSNDGRQGSGAGEARVRKLSNVSHRNIQLLSMKPRSERDAYADGLRSRRRSSLINLILGAPSSGPRFSDDLCSLSSHMSELCNFGIEFFPDGLGNQARQQQQQQQPGRYQRQQPPEASLRAEHIEVGAWEAVEGNSPPEAMGRHDSGAATNQRRRRSSLGSLTRGEKLAPPGDVCDELSAADEKSAKSTTKTALVGHEGPAEAPGQRFRPPPSTTPLASIDLGSSFEWARAPIADEVGRPAATGSSLHEFRRPTRGRLNLSGRVLRRSGSELSLYSNLSTTTTSTTSGSSSKFSAHHQAAGRQSHGHNSQGRMRLGPELGPGARKGDLGVARSASGLEEQPEVGRASGPMRPEGDRRETKLIIMLQVCLPFILAGFGNMGAGLTLNKIAHWRAFHEVPIFFVLLPPFVGLKGNIEMTLASRLSTLANLSLLGSGYQRRRAYVSNLILILSQAIGLSLFAAIVSILCEFLLAGKFLSTGHRPGGGLAPTGSGPGVTAGGLSTATGSVLELACLVVLPSALMSSVILVIISSLIMSLAIILAGLIQVNPDNLSTLIAALYGDVTCVLTYGLVADWMYSLHRQGLAMWPLGITCVAIISWPGLWFMAYKFKETKSIALSSMPPMLAAILVSMGSGAVLSLVVERFSLIALYQPVVNGFGANLIAVQASRVSTWLWCSALRRLSVANSTTAASAGEGLPEAGKKLAGSLASFRGPGTGERDSSDADEGVDQHPPDHDGHRHLDQKQERSEGRLRKGLGRTGALLGGAAKTLLWSFFNPSPNSTAARLLMLMLVPAHSLYFFVIWLLSPSNYIVVTWQFYSIYIMLCLVQVFLLLTVCEPLMALLMDRHLDPDIFGISLLMALADLTGTLCLAGAFLFLASLGDPNAH